ncbi:hypothetical protein MNBD_ALPHA11-2253 [hydrothermal vent metagenome]|uniref:YdhG-like domain-containing protein n=1 Tax=hydrothermal vent metagenome TaxID=652676 RepID=A0A3B0U1N6_9ZZZZ
MDKLPKEKVAAFLDELHQSDVKKFTIVEQCRSLFFSIHPSGNEYIKYGGIMFSLSRDVAGLFAYKNYVSMELSFGYSMDDPDKILQGCGKFRRHIKFSTVDQIDEKRLEFFLRQLSVKTT